MARQNEINFRLNFLEGNTQGISSIKRQLQEVRDLVQSPDAGFMQGEIQKILSSVNTLESAMQRAFDPQLNTVNIQKFNALLKENGTTVTKLYSDLSLMGTTGQKAFLQMTSELMKFNTATKQTNKFLDSIAISLFNTIRQSALSSIVNSVVGSIQKAYYYVKDLDSGLNDIRIVTGKSADEMERFAIQANKAAKELAVSTEDYTQGSLIYYQQGLDDTTVQTLTDITAKASNVTGQSMSSVSEQLTAVQNGYQVANQAAAQGMGVYEEYVDKMAAVGASTASNLEELATAMSKVASAASSMGVDFDDLNAQIATIVSVTRQAPESVGTALKTIYARLGDLQVDGVDEFGTKLGEVSGKLKTMGIEVLDANGDLRNMSDVMIEVAAKQDTWTSAQKEAAAVAMAGKRQYNNLVALFDNQDMYGEALKTSMSAAGTLEKQQEIAMDSLKKKMIVLQATAEDLYSALFDTDTISSFVGVGTKVLQFFADFSEGIGGLNNLLPMLGSIGLKVFGDQIGRGIATIVTNTRNAINEQKLMKANFLEIQNMYANTNLFQAQNLPKESQLGMVAAEEIGKIKQYYQEMYQYQSIMTKEQKDQYNILIDTQVKLSDYTVTLQEMKDNQARSYDSLKLINQETVATLDTTKTYSTEIEKINNILFALDAVAEKGKIDADEILKALTVGEGKLQQSDIATKRLLNTFTKVLASTGDEEAALQKVVERVKEVANNVNKIHMLGQQKFTLGENLNSSQNALFDVVKMQALYANITKTIGAVGQLSSSLMTLKNIGNIINDDNLSSFDKALQITMNLSFSIPTLVASIKTLKGSLVDLAAAQLGVANTAEVANAKAAISIALDGTKITTKKFLTTEISKETLIQALLNKKVKEYAKAKGIEAINVDQSTRAKLKHEAALEAETLMTKKATVAQGAFNKIVAAFPVATVVAAVGTLLALIATLAIKSETAALEIAEAERKKAQEQRDNFEKQRKTVREEIDANQELVQSYLDLYEQYEDGVSSKDALIEKTESLKDVLGEEIVAVATLTGNYELLNEEAKKYRDQTVDEKLNQNEKDTNLVKQQMQSLLNKDKTVFNQTEGFSLSREEDFINAISSDELLNKYFSGKGFRQGRGVHEHLIINKEDFTEEEANEFLYEALPRLRELSKEQDLDIDESYINELVQYFAEMRNIKQDTAVLNISSDLIDKYNIDSTEKYSEFNDALNYTINQLVASGKNEEASYEEALQILSSLGANEDFIERAKATQSLTKKYGQEYAEEIRNQLSNYSKEEVGLILEMDLDQEDFSNNLDLFLTRAKTKAEQEQIPVKVSLINEFTDFIQKGEEVTEEFKQKFQDGFYSMDINQEEFWDGFDSAETPIEKLNQIQNIIEETNKTIYDNAVDSEKLQAEAEIEYARLEKELESSQERIKELKEEKEQGGGARTVNELKQVSAEAEKIAEEMKEQDKYRNLEIDFDDTALQMFSNIVDNITTGADLIKDAAELIGESFVVAAEDAEALFSVYPALYDQAVVLADGNIQLNEEVVKTVLNGNSDIIKSNTEVADAQLQQQIDILQAQIDYNESKMEILDQYLKGEISQKKTEEKLNKAGAEFEAKLEDAVGETAVNNAKAALDANNDLTHNTLLNLDKIGEQANILGEALKKALAGETANYSSSGGGHAGGSISDYKNFADEAISKVKAENADAAAAAEAEMARLKGETGELEKKLANALVLQSRLRAGSKAAQDAAQNAASGKGGKLDSGSSGSSDRSQKDKKEQKDEYDRYQEIKKAIDAVDKALSKLDKDQENLFGYELINSLKEENKLLEQQAANYNTLYEMQKQEAAELQGQLGASGVMFDASGAIINYAAATSSALAQYSAAIDQYNAGLIDETTLGVYETAYENFKTALERYDTLYYNEMQETQEKLEDMLRQQRANNLQAQEVEIEIHLNEEEAKRDLNDFLKEIEQDFRKVYSDLTIDVDYDQKNFQSIVNDVYTVKKAISDVEAEITKMANGGTSDMFESISQAQEKLKELQKQLLDQGRELHDLYKNVQDAYLEGIDQVKDQFDELMSRYEHFNNVLEHQRDIIELVYGDEAYDKLNTYYEGMIKNNEAQIALMRQQAEMWQTEFDKAYAQAGKGVDLEDFTTQTEDMKKAYENMIESQESLNDLIAEGVKLLQDKYLNTINEIMDTMDKGIQGKNGFDGMKENQEQMQKMADEYLDDVQGAYKVQSLANKIDQSIADTTNLKAQQKLQALRESEINMLREKENLTQADIDLAEARYQIALKEIALEDAQNNKTSMKMTRNEQGNWSYQYVADEGDVANKQQDLLSSYANLYELANNSYEHSMELAMNLYDEFRQKFAEISNDDTISQEKKHAKLLELQEQYLEQMNIAFDNAEIYKREGMTATGAVFAEVCNQDAENYTTLTDKQKELVNEIRDLNLADYEEIRAAVVDEVYPQIGDSAKETFEETNLNSQTLLAEMSENQVTNEDSFKNIVLDAIDKIKKATINYEKELDELQKIAGVDFSKVEESIEKVINKIDSMEGTTEKMVANSSKYLDELREVLSAVEEAWQGIIGKVIEAQGEMRNYATEAKAAEAAAISAIQAAGVAANMPSSGSGTPTSQDPNPSGPETKGKWSAGVNAGVNLKYHQTYDTLDQIRAQANDAKQHLIGQGYEESIIHSVAIGPNGQRVSLFRSGGYTGSWNGEDGRLAMLHQKELVLNADDTKNFLSGISMIRDMTSLNGSISNAITTAVANMMVALSSPKAGTGISPAAASESTNNVFNITAEFPNANDVDEIRQAILGLPNLASQYIGRSSR